MTALQRVEDSETGSLQKQLYSVSPLSFGHWLFEYSLLCCEEFLTDAEMLQLFGRLLVFLEMNSLNETNTTIKN